VEIVMLCLSVYPHWAWAIIHGEKRIENRTWKTNIRGRIFIHASCSQSPLSPSDRRLLAGMPDVSSLAGCIIGSVEIVDCVPLCDVEGERYASGPWCWILARPRSMRPLHCRGAARFWRAPRSVAQRIPRSL
jgi:hypothetical protein